MKRLTPLELLQYKDQFSKMKVKDYRYAIRGTHTFRPLIDLIKLVAAMLLLPVMVSVVIFFVDKLYPIDNFFLAYLVVCCLITFLFVKLWKL